MLLHLQLHHRDALASNEGLKMIIFTLKLCLISESRRWEQKAPVEGHIVIDWSKVSNGAIWLVESKIYMVLQIFLDLFSDRQWKRGSLNPSVHI